MRTHLPLFNPQPIRKIGAFWSLFLFICLFNVPAFGQTNVISGTVLDQETSEPLIGVNVAIKSKMVGTVTDLDGAFRLEASPTDTLVFSYIGYTSKEFPATGNKIDVKLSTAAEMLEEVIVVGYGSVVKEDITGVVTKVDEEVFNKGVNNSPENLLTGKVAGLQITTNGEPGGSTHIRLRGGTSLDASSNPLIVVDGVPLTLKEDESGVKKNASGRNPLNFINASDIADITVLKDASAAAIYGSRGANGVIIITTKSGQSGKLKVDYNGFYSISDLGQQVDILKPNTFRQAISAKAPQNINKLGDVNTEWVDEVLELASSMQHNLSLSGGFDKSRYYVSLNYLDNNGILKTSNSKKSNIALNFSTKLFDDQLELQIKSLSGFTKDQFTPNVIGAAQTFDPTQPVFDADSKYGGYFQWDDPLAVNNPVSTIDLTDEKGNAFRSLNNLTLQYHLPWVEGLSVKSNISYDFTDGEKTRLRNPLLKDSETFDRGGNLFTETEDLNTQLIETYGIYKRTLENINSNLEFTFGHSWQENHQANRWTEGNGLEMADNEFGYMRTTDIKSDSFIVESRLISFFGRLNYGFSDKYLLTFTYRRDGSSRFGPSNQWGNFYSGALGWRVLQEEFAAGLRQTFSNLKLRLSYGVTGNEDIEDFLYATFYSYSTDDASYQFGDDFVNTLRGVGVDPNIKWEETSSLNVGLDFGFLNNRLTGSIDWYKKFTNDLLFTVAAGAFTNLSDRILTNIGKMENQGIELALSSYVVDRRDFDWKAGFNIAYNTNEITKLDNSNLPDFGGYETGGIAGDVGQTIQILKVGESVNTFRTYRHILDANGNPTPDTEDRDGDGIAGPLDMYEDINNDGIINENDLVVGETATPDVIMGFTSNVYYKDFDLSFTLRSNLGNYVYNNVASSTGYFDRLSDRVTNNIDESAFETNFKTKQLKSDHYIENASFLKLDNITLGYNIKAVEFLQALRVYATVQNVLTLTGYTGLDPELPQFNNGIDNNIYPVSRTYLFGINASF